METMLIGKKVGMTRIFGEDGEAIAVSVVKAEPNLIIGYTEGETNRVKVAAVKTKKLNKPDAGQLKGKTEAKLKVIREFVSEKKYKVGDELTVGDFKEGDKVNVIGTSKGKGFAGVIKRHNFSRGPETHGSDHHRKPGSIGSMFPQHVLKGQKMPGHLGHARVTVKNLRIEGIDKNDSLLLISGAVPGIRGSLITIYK
jgi:large subunit ribosomal protein L3